MKDLGKTGARKSSLGEQGLRENGNPVGESRGKKSSLGEKGLRENGNPVGEGFRENRSPEGEKGLRENGIPVGEGLRENRSLEGEGSRVNFKDKLCHYDDAISGKFSQPQPASFLCVKLALFFI